MDNDSKDPHIEKKAKAVLGEISTFLPFYLVSFVIFMTLIISIKLIKEQNSSNTNTSFQ